MYDHAAIQSYSQVWGVVETTISEEHDKSLPNKVRLEFPPVGDEEHKRFAELQIKLAQHSEELDYLECQDYLTDRGIHLFRGLRWSNIHAKCGCSDFCQDATPGVPVRPDSVPCKHKKADCRKKASGHPRGT